MVLPFLGVGLNASSGPMVQPEQTIQVPRVILLSGHNAGNGQNRERNRVPIRKKRWTSLKASLARQEDPGAWGPTSH